MKILITGVCGFVGSTLAAAMAESGFADQITGVDNFSRPGSELNRRALQAKGVQVIPGDIRVSSDVESLPQADWIIDAAANPSVLAGVDGKTSSRQLIEHNLSGTINLLEYCKQHAAGFVLLSTSRVYSIPPLASLKMVEVEQTFRPDVQQAFPPGASEQGMAEHFSTAPPVSLYGSTKVASECLALEYGETFQFPVWINRCGVLAGATQFGHPAQGIFSYWIHSFREKSALKYIGFGGNGYQVRDCLHPRDLIPLLKQQTAEPLDTKKPRVSNFAGGVENSMSLARLTAWCAERFEPMEIIRSQESRPFDIPWMVLDSSQAAQAWNWRPTTKMLDVLEEIAAFAETQPDWLAISRG